ncbi:MAG: hypothetical protein KKF12_22570 [Proteobacteria bacterium]|nr:hypothetical protein [Pseudomonadota bacterium]MBU4133613.1 hypothetical protein [Pseudomonadota bacterium]
MKNIWEWPIPAVVTVQREVSDLVEKGILIKLSGGKRSSSYDLDWRKGREYNG